MSGHTIGATARLVACLAAAALAFGCRANGLTATPPPSTTGEPYALVLGTAQDGGLPQLGCTREACRRARQDPSLRRRVASLAIVDPASGRRWLVDATPDLPEQLELVRGRPPTRPIEMGETGEAGATGATGAPGRPALFDGILLTHAHIGHYTGLIFLGPEAYGSETTTLHVSARMAGFLRDNGPWSLLVDAGHVELAVFEPEQPIELAPGLSVTPIEVTHRDEFSDTHAFVFEGPHATLLYLPDIDKWERWGRAIEDLLERVDVALVDGTFFDGREVPERDMEQIAHPFIVESLERFADLPQATRKKIVFTHLNHSNPAAFDGPEARRIRELSMRVAREGERIPL